MEESASCLSQPETEAFTILVLRYLDGVCEAAETTHLRGVLVSSASHRELFVHLCRLQGEMHEAFAQQRVGVRHKKANGPVAVPAGTNRVGSGSDREVPAATDQREMLGSEFPLEHEAPADASKAEPDDTVTRELAMDDTIHPAPKPPQP